MGEYHHRAIEKKWQNFWETNKTFSVSNTSTTLGNGNDDAGKQKNFYALDMFPFPSGAGLHVGHPEGYTATDIICRKKRMEGYNVLHPMGWDAFGLPAENFAIKTGQHPQVSTDKNIENFTRQIKSLGFSYDWDREFSTTDPSYYKWTQDIFLKLYNKGLLYEDEKPLNWCPSCKVVCANEEVEQGLHERCGNAVTKKSLRQWMFKITQYAERLLGDLDTANIILLHGWGGTGDQGWFGEIKNFCKANKIALSGENFPNTDTPTYSEWKEFFEENILPKVNSQTIFIAHSLGNNFLMQYASEHEIIAQEFIAVAPVLQPRKDLKQTLSTFFESDIDWKKVKNSFDTITIFGSDNDPYIPIQDFETIAKNFEVKFNLLEGQEHISQNNKNFPEVVEILKTRQENFLDWPEKIKAMQRNWIGKSEGLLFTSPLLIENGHNKSLQSIQTYSTHFEAFYADTFVVIAPDHGILKDLLEGVENQTEILEKAKEIIANREKLGFEEEKESEGIFTGRYINDPIGNGRLPIWIASYALADYGTGIVKCSCHDERDFKFAKKYNIPLKAVLLPEDKIESEKVKNLEYCYTDMKHGILSEPIKFAGQKAGGLRNKIIEFAKDKNFAEGETNYRLRDWIFTRQRYWGEPIPLVFDEDGKCYPLDESELPVLLPKTPNYEPSESGESPLAKITDWVNVEGYVTEEGKVRIITHPSTSLGDRSEGKVEISEGVKIQKFRRETSTMPNWAGSSWYYLRFMDSQNDQEAWSAEAEAQWGPVDLYVGGAEHAVLHLLYARFWHKALYDLGMVTTKEPFKKLVNQGLILSYAYQREAGGLVPTDEVEEKIDSKHNGESKFYEIATGKELKKIVAKMSKSLKNVINPDEIVDAYGADTLRMYEMFMGPFEQNKAWDTAALEGMNKFLMRIWRLFDEKKIIEGSAEGELRKLTHQTVKKVSSDIDEFKFNTAISQMMIWMNGFSKLEEIPTLDAEKFIRLLAPFAPHLAEEIWQSFDSDQERKNQSDIEPVEMKTITFEPWPTYEEKFLVEDSIKYAVQVNGKLRGDFEIAKDASKEDCIAKGKGLEKVQKFITELGGEEKIRKEIFVPGKIVGFVVK